MKKIISALLLGTLHLSLNAEPLIVFGQNIEITENCKIKSMNKNGEARYTNLVLPASTNCKFIRYDETNLIHMEQIGNFYMFLVESTSGTEDECISNHTAIAVNRNGEILPADYNQKSKTCNIDRETKLYSSFAYDMKLIK